MTYAFGDWQAPLDAASWSARELWLACFALGGNFTPQELDQYLEGRTEPALAEHNLLALALNERLHDLGYDRPVPYQAAASSGA